MENNINTLVENDIENDIERLLESDIQLNTINNIYDDLVSDRVMISLHDQPINNIYNEDNVRSTINSTISQDIVSQARSRVAQNTENNIRNADNTNIENQNTQNELQNNEHFYHIINSFCNSLIEFALSIKQPTDDISKIIYKRSIRNESFDNYVKSVQKFTDIIRNVISLLRTVILSLNKLFVIRSVDSITEFMSNLGNFLQYLLVEDVFVELKILRDEIRSNHKNNVDILEKIKIIKRVMHHVVNISIDVTSLIIPQLGVIKEIVTVFNDRIEERLDIRIGEISRINNNLDNVVRQLLDIQLRAVIIEAFQNHHVLNFLNNYDTKELILISENLQAEYIELLHTVLSLHSTIELYKKKKKGILLSLANFIKC